VNFLAHAYLSFGKGEILTGNLMADFIRGKPLPELPEEIKKGILLHREIDDFTDHHEINKDTYQYFRASSGRFAPVFLDIAYDYFLANHIRYFATQNQLDEFASQTYALVESNISHTDERFQSMFYRMRDQNWLARYNKVENIARSFHSVTFRTKHITDTAPVFDEFQKYEKELKSAFDAFFPDLENHVKNLLFRDD
jgi:acyl carrier protein phosphodiesterase